MTLYSSTQEMDNKIKEMYNTLCEILEDYVDEVDRSLTFAQLVEMSESIITDDVYYTYNVKPVDNIVFNEEDTLLRKEIKIYYKIEFLTQYLQYIALLKGVPPEYIQQANTLRESIELLRLIKKLQPVILTLDIQDYTYYYNSYCIIPYTVTSNNQEVDAGSIVVLEDNIQIARIPVGEELKFLPTDIGKHKYTFYYEGTGIYRSSTAQKYTFNILPAKIRLNVQATNVGESQYHGNSHIGYDEDIFNITVNTINPYIDFPATDVPFTIKVPQNSGYKTFTGVTDSNGVANVVIYSNKIDTFDIDVQTTSTSNKVSNASEKYSLTIYCNPIKIDDYKFYENQIDKDMELFFYDITGELTNQYINHNYHIFVNEDYRDFLLNNITNPFIIQEAHTELGRYEYKYVLKDQNGKVIATTTNTVKINKEIKIKIIPENKFLTQNTKTINVHVYTTDYKDDPINLDFKFINSYTGVIDTIYTSTGHYVATINVESILSKCNGFLLQAVAVEDEDILSNTIYYRINNQTELDTEIIIECEDSYNLNERILHINAFLIDSEGDNVNRAVKISNGISTYTINYDHATQSSHLDLDTPESQIGDNINLTISYDGEQDHYLSSISQKTIDFIKSNVDFIVTYSQGIVYEDLNISAICSIDDNDDFNKYITGEITITINNEEFLMTKDNNLYDLTVVPLEAGNAEVVEQYSGGKWTNQLTHYTTINIDKTDKYILSCDLSDDEIFIFESITFTPQLTKDTEIDQTFSGTITYEFSDGTIYNRSIEPFTYTSTQAGNQSVTITYNGDNNHYFKSITKTFVVKKFTPTLTLNVPEIDAIYRSDIDYKENNISYSGNDEELRVKIYEDDIEKYNQSGKEYDEKIFNITSSGEHIIRLETDETDIYNSLTLERNIKTYDFLEETYKMMNEADYTDEYLIQNKTEEIFDCIINDTDDYDQDILEGLYKILEHLED